MYDKLYEAAKLDLESVKILMSMILFLAPAIYLSCREAIEKCAKAIDAYYMIKLQHVSRHDVGDKLRKKDRHNLLEPTRVIVKKQIFARVVY